MTHFIKMQFNKNCWFTFISVLEMFLSQRYNDRMMVLSKLRGKAC